MAWWGKVIGGAFGFMLGGPLGALLGGALGHKLDEGFANLGGQLDSGNQERVQAAFYTATFSIMGHISKSDGRVSKEEIAHAQSIMGHMKLSEDQKKAAIELFNQGKRDDFELEPILVQFRRECRGRTTLLRMFVEIQIQAALSDGQFDPRERGVLEHVTEILGFNAHQLDEIIRRIQGGGAARNKPQGMGLQDAYKVLGVDKNTPLDDVKKAYRRLLSQHHPDKLVSKGLPEEMVKLANEKTHEIRTAWKRIQEAKAS